MKRRTWARAATAVLAAAAATGGVVAMSSADQAAPAAPEAPANAATVQKADLSARISLTGILTRRARPDGSPYSAINQATGIYTGLPDQGDRVDCGDVLFRVDEDPVLLLCGTVPAYRDLQIGDEGHDVHQLNRNVHDLGYGADAGDDEFTWRTQAGLRRLQHDRGLDETGTLELDDAVFLPRSIRIAEVTVKLGGSARAGAEVARATSSALEVQAQLEASQQGEVQAGDRAQVTLPGNRVVQGRVVRLGRVAQTAGKDDDDVAGATIPAFIRLDDPRTARGLDTAPVQVEITTEVVKNALSVPVTALVGKAGGGFAVEVVRDGGRRELVVVKLGLFDTASGRVQVQGALREGDRVVVPSP